MSLVVEVPKLRDVPIRKASYWWSPLWSFFSIWLWGALPARLQKAISNNYASIYNTKFSRRLIEPYCKWHYSDADYLDQFVPPDGKSDYHSFQDFFTREFAKAPKIESTYIWPCEGILCHSGKIEVIRSSNVKGDVKSVYDIFGVSKDELPSSHYFSNVFLHNKNYHRIHSPVSGRITRIQHVPDQLVILRPWIYKENPSVPAFRNERMNIDIEDKEGSKWFLSIVGGPAVGTIKINKQIELGTAVSVLDELASFELGSTCCMASPYSSNLIPYRSEIYVGDSYS